MTPETIQTILLSVIGLIATALVPYAFILERRLSRIETKLSNGISENVKDHGERLHHIELELARGEKAD